MEWVVGIIGFLSGFALGQIALLRWLKDRTRAELMNNKDLHFKYGLINWAFAILGALCALWVYDYYV
jgi:hypothetical protein